jgi:hypothetical protein
MLYSTIIVAASAFAGFAHPLLLGRRQHCAHG